MILDLSPMVINRTAVFKIGQSLVENLQNSQKIQIGIDRLKLSDLEEYLSRSNSQKRLFSSLDKKSKRLSFSKVKNRHCTWMLYGRVMM